jgi:hypothetical protein
MLSAKTFTTHVSKEEMEREMKQATKEEMEKLATAMKNNISKKNDFEEEFFINTEQDDNDTSNDDTSSESSVSSAVKLLSDINKIKSKEKKGRKEKKEKKKDNISLVQSVVLIEKLKGEVNKLESRIRYKDLDMSNLNLEIMKLNEVQDKYKLITDILTELQNKEIQIFDLNQSFKNVNFNQSSKLVIYQLEELIKKYEKFNTLEKTDLLKIKINSINNQIFSRLILDKENVIVTEFNKTQLSIYNKINYVNQINLVEFYCWSLVIGLIVLYGLYLLINYILI